MLPPWTSICLAILPAVALGCHREDGEVAAVCDAELRAFPRATFATREKCVEAFASMKRHRPAELACVKECFRAHAADDDPTAKLRLTTCKMGCAARAGAAE